MFMLSGPMSAELLHVMCSYLQEGIQNTSECSNISIYRGDLITNLCSQKKKLSPPILSRLAVVFNM